MENITKVKKETNSIINSVAVIIPYFNGSETIERALKSVRNQTIRPTEVIVVDDGSTTVESEFLDKLKGQFAFQTVKQNNGGQGAARNMGVHRCSSNFVCFLDQDDFFAHNHIEILLCALPEDRTMFGWIYGDLTEADFDGNTIRTRMIKDHSDHPKTRLFNMIGGDMFVPDIPQVAYRLTSTSPDCAS